MKSIVTLILIGAFLLGLVHLGNSQDLLNKFPESEKTHLPDIYATALESNRASQFLSMANDMGMGDLMRTSKGITVIVPTDAAMRTLPAFIKKKMDEDDAYKKAFVNQYLFYGVYSAASTSRNVMVKNMAGQTVKLSRSSTKSMIMTTGNQSTTSGKALRAENGLLYFTNKATYPPIKKTKKAKTSKKKAPTVLAATIPKRQ
jgi:uncharacterized surface protein with fasciclin (FAS1) repeats